MGAAFLQALRACLGDPNVLVDGDLDAFEVDWRKRYRGRALAVARPSCTAELAAHKGYCITYMGRPNAAMVGSGLHINFSLVPVGGGTGSNPVGGATEKPW